MHPLRSSLLAITLFSLPSITRADVIKTFNLDATFDNTIYTENASDQIVGSPTTVPISVSGTISVDTTTGLFAGGNVTVDSDGTIFVFDTADAVIHSELPGYYPNEIDFYNSFTTPTVLFGVAVPGSLLDYNGSAICSATNLSGQCTDMYDATYTSAFEDVGVATPFVRQIGVGALNTSTTPEPSSLALLATGLLSVSGALRKRLTRS